MTAALALSSATGQVAWLEEAASRCDGHVLEVACSVYDVAADGTTDLISVCQAYRDSVPADDVPERVDVVVRDALRELEAIGLVARMNDEITLTLAPLYNLKEGD